MRNSKPVTVTLGDQRHRVEERVRSGAYSSVSEVIRAGLRALDREEAALDALLKARVRRSLADPGPDIPADDVFAEIWAEHEAADRADRR